MSAFEAASDLSSQFVHFARGATEVWVRKDCQQALLPDGERYVERMLPRLLSSARDVLIYRGRGQTVSFPVPALDDRIVVRHYRHGGWLRHVTGDLFWTRPVRPFVELTVSQEARRLGVSTPQVLAAVVRWVTPVLYRGDLITREVPQARDLLEFFSGETRHLERRKVLRELAGTIRAMHDCQLHHEDLNVRNVLLSGERAVILDLDGARFYEILGSRRIKANLLRLARSMRKEGLAVSDREVLYFLYAYHGEDFRDVYSEEYSGEFACQKHSAD
ncbi:MAG: hypothetical protein HY814_08625 [Candidatus Riflebacteria bacterium]|nr:hypothetical protein [Candidatus Riflebacteria bacterium]